MNPQCEPDLKVALRYWETRKKHDSYLMWIAIVVSLFAVMNDFVRPSEGAGFVVILCLCGIVLTCLRLLKSVAKVIVLRRLVQLFLQ